MKLSTIAGLPALAILVTENRHGFAASLFTSHQAAMEDVVRELKEHYDAPADLTTDDGAIGDFIGNEGITYSYSVEEMSLPGYRVIALNTATGEILANRFCSARTLTEAEHFAGLIWNQYGAFQPDRGIKVFLYTITGDEPILTIDDEDEALPEGERTTYFSERGQYWYVDEVQGGERVTIAKNLTQDQANAVQAGQQPFDGVTGDLS